MAARVKKQTRAQSAFFPPIPEVSKLLALYEYKGTEIRLAFYVNTTRHTYSWAFVNKKDNNFPLHPAFGPYVSLQSMCDDVDKHLSVGNRQRIA